MIYDYKVLKNEKEKDLSEHKGKVMLIINTASKCGLTPQFEGLEKIYKEYKDKGLVILGFPCDQFAKQEYSDNKEITNFCQINYGVSFPIYDKIDVNGKTAHPLFNYLKNEKKGFLSKEIKWNFTKFLVDKDGKVIKRFAPTVTPDKIVPYIEKLL